MMKLKEVFDNAERIGVIGSPSSTGGLTIDVLGTAANKKLVGNLSVFQYIQEGKYHYALGQITEILLQNVWTQDPTMRGIIRQKGRVDPITERQDVHTAKMIVSSVFAEEGGKVEPSLLGTVPPTGTSVRVLNEDIMKTLLVRYAGELFYLGKVYGTNIKMPMWLKHFGSGEFGAGEAYHIGVFGKTGSGKSVLAKMMMVGYARHKDMSIFVLDPQGDFAKEFRVNQQIIEQYKILGKDVKIYHIGQLVLDDESLFVKILAKSNFWEGLVRSYEYRVRAGDTLLDFLKRQSKRKTVTTSKDLTSFDQFNKKENVKPLNEKEISIFEFHNKEIFTKNIWEILKDPTYQNRVYSKQYAQDFENVIKNSDPEEFYQRWSRVARLFTWEGRKNAITIKRLIYDEALKLNSSTKPFIVIDLSRESLPEDILWNDEIQILTIKRILDVLSKVAEEQYKMNRLLNSLVVIDEAHRFAPREKVEDEALNEVRKTLIDAVRTTRKYGLGWMFISQTLSSLAREIIEQIRIFVFGFGLGWGVELHALKEIIGGQEEAITLYQMFRDPQSGLGEKEYPFMAIGPISPLSFSGSPLFFTALRYPDEFLETNFGGKDENK